MLHVSLGPALRFQFLSWFLASCPTVVPLTVLSESTFRTRPLEAPVAALDWPSLAVTQTQIKTATNQVYF